MSLEDHLKIPTVEESKGEYKPRLEWDGSTGFLQTRGLTAEPDHSDILREVGLDPAKVRIIGDPRISKWQTYDERWLTAYKFILAPTGSAGIEELMKGINRKRAPRTQAQGDGVFHWLVGDLQLGKVDGDGTEGIVERYLSSVDAGVAEFKALRKRRSLGTIHAAWLGDCGEGNQSQNGNNFWRTSLTITEQYRLFRRLQLYTIDAFAPLVERFEGVTVNGNHDRVQNFQATRMDDGHATEATIALADGLALNPSAYGHVKLLVPHVDEGTLTYDVAGSGTVFTHAHGHQWPKGQQWRWWSEQALNLQTPGAASFLVHGHTHELYVGSKRDRTFICVPTFEAESTYWRQLHGDVARPGAVTLTTSGTEWRDVNLV